MLDVFNVSYETLCVVSKSSDPVNRYPIIALVWEGYKDLKLVLITVIVNVEITYLTSGSNETENNLVPTNIQAVFIYVLYQTDFWIDLVKQRKEEDFTKLN